MLPPMAIFFPIFTLLEDVGYLPRVAFNLDHAFCKARTCGKQALTMCKRLYRAENKRTALRAFTALFFWSGSAFLQERFGLPFCNQRCTGCGQAVALRGKRIKKEFAFGDKATRLDLRRPERLENCGLGMITRLSSMA